MNRIYKIESNYTVEEYTDLLYTLSEDEKDLMLEFIESSEKLDLYKKADGTFILTEIYDYDEEINEDIDSDVILTIADEYKVNNLNRVF